LTDFFLFVIIFRHAEKDVQKVTGKNRRVSVKNCGKYRRMLGHPIKSGSLTHTAQCARKLN